jgi:rRNA maturation endonuclease Nob1
VGAVAGLLEEVGAAMSRPYLYRCVGCGWEYQSDRIFLSSVEHACPQRGGRVTLLKLVDPERRSQ